jgi:methyl-accepting chemotaxis protein
MEKGEAYMKIKGKLVVSFIAMILFLTISMVTFTYIEMSHLVKEETNQELHNYSNMGLQLIDRSYSGEWNIKDGQLYKGSTALNGNNQIIDEFTEGMNILATFFAYDIRVATNVMDQDGNRQVDTKASQAVIDQVLNAGEIYRGAADILGRSAQTYYVPLKDNTGTVIGMWFVGVYTDVVSSSIFDTMRLISLLGIFLLGVGSIVSYVIGNSFAKGIKEVKVGLKQMEEGQFNFAFKESLLKRKDEIGEIANSSKKMQQKIAKTVWGIQSESQKVKAAAVYTAVNMEEVHGSIEEISSRTEELSAGMELTAGSIEEMNASTHDIESEVGQMKKKTKGGEVLANDIKQRAGHLKEQTQNSQKSAMQIYMQTKNQLTESMTRAKAIEQIKELSSAILQIMEQTNILALNASIEAVRVGEAGKGFAVVAEEIRKLADHSKEAVSKINEVTTNVSDAVGSVVADANGLLEFVETRVHKDYDTFVGVSNQYEQDADAIQDVVTEVNNISEKLYEAIGQIRLRIDEVTVAAGEGAEGTQVIANKISDIAEKANQVLQKEKQNQESAQNLDEMVEYFQL